MSAEPHDRNKEQDPSRGLSKSRGLLEALSREISGLAHLVGPSVARVEVMKPRGGTSSRGPISGNGSGAVMASDGFIATNSHVAGGAIACQVSLPLNGGQASAELLLKSAEEACARDPEAYCRVLETIFGKKPTQTRRAYDLFMRLPFKSYVTPNLRSCQ